MMTITILAVIYLVAFAGARPDVLPPDGARRSDPAGGPRCDASSLETMTCPAGHYCNIDTCVKIEVDPECGEGESCRECDCKSGLVCHHNTCMAPNMVEEVPLICQEDENLSKAVKRLVELCKTRKADPGKIVSTASCSVQEWEELALKDKDFDLMLAAFPNRFAVHFPIGRRASRAATGRSRGPRPRDRADPAYRQVLGEAKQIFVIGRASPDGDPETNHVLALARMNLVSEMIEKVVHEGMTPTERAKHPIHSRSFTLPTTRPIRPEKYDRVYYLKNPPGSKSLGLDPLMAWDEKSRKDLKTKLGDTALINEVGSPEYAKLLNAINRVVLVIPIPCTGDEYEQRRNDLEAAAAAAAAGGAP
jgi:hypothetical protein